MGSIQKEWLVYFYNARTVKYAKWLWWWKPPYGFSHCGALNYDTVLKKWINMEFTHANIKVEILDDEQSDNLFNKLLAFKILICPQKEDWHLMRIKELSCVSFVMRLIGFFRWYVITPHQLYCALIKNGYEPFWKHDRPKKKIATRNN